MDEINFDRYIIRLLSSVFDVFQELDLLEPSADVFKLTGPVLVKQELSEAKQNVDKRLKYISDEMYVFFKFGFV